MYWAYGFHEIWEISQLIKDLLASPNSLCSMPMVGSLVGRLFSYEFSQCGNIPSKERTFILTQRDNAPNCLPSYHPNTHKTHYLVILMGRVACHWRVAGSSQMVCSWLLQHGHTTPSTLLWNMQVCEHNGGIQLFRCLILNGHYKIQNRSSQSVSQTFLVQVTTQGNSDASTAGCRGPMRSQWKAAIMNFLQYHLMVYQVYHIYIWSN
jgi:hypothetical protein